VFQTLGLVLFFVSMIFRMKSNYLVHGIIIILLVVIGWVVTVVSIPSFMDNASMEPYLSSSSSLVLVSLHILFGAASLIFATWLVALWRPRSTDFAIKTEKIWKLTAMYWILAYIVGLLLYVALTTTIL
jgi:hypothetical protein